MMKRLHAKAAGTLIISMGFWKAIISLMLFHHYDFTLYITCATLSTQIWSVRETGVEEVLT